MQYTHAPYLVHMYTPAIVNAFKQGAFLNRFVRIENKVRIIRAVYLCIF